MLRPRTPLGNSRPGRHSTLPVAAVLATLAASIVGVAAYGPTQAGAADVAATVRLSATADAFVSPYAPHRTTGSADYLTAGSRSAHRQVIYLRFTIPAADTGRIQAATLQLTRTSHHLSGTVIAHAVNSDAWQERSIDAANAPAVGATLDSQATGRATNTVSLDVTTAAQNTSVVDLAVTLTAPRGFAQFHSRESTGTGPRLTLTLGGSDTPAASVGTAGLSATADAFVSPYAPHHTTGSADYLTAGSRSAHRQVIYLRFTIPAADTGRIQAATLQLTRTSHHLSGTVIAHAVNSDAWQERSIDAANAPAVGATLDSQATGRATNTVSLDVTTAAQNTSVVDLAVTLTAPRGFAQFHSRESTGTGPRLTLTLGGSDTPTTPSPAPSPTLGNQPPQGGTTQGGTTQGGTTQGGTQSSSPSGSSGCTVSAKLVSSCGVWWGAAPMAYLNLPLSTSVPQEEQLANRPLDIVHTYHVNGQLFPTAAERAEALAPGSNRLLLINWKPATDMTWAAVAAGQADARIDALANYIDATFPYRFFLTVWHEPENDVIATPGSGMTAADYAAMYRHVVLRLRRDGVDNAVTVMNYMGFDKWAVTSWFGQLWPGDDVVDWIGLDPYGTGATSGYTAQDFPTLVNRPLDYFPGYYTWATTAHPGKPIMLAEWGVVQDPANPDGQARFFADVASELRSFPAIHALVYFDMPQPPSPGWVTSPDTTSTVLSSYRRLADSTAVAAARFTYAGS